MNWKTRKALRGSSKQALFGALYGQSIGKAEARILAQRWMKEPHGFLADRRRGQPKPVYSDGSDRFTLLKKPKKLCEGNPRFLCCNVCSEAKDLQEPDAAQWWELHSRCWFDESDGEDRWLPALILVDVVPEGFDLSSDLSAIEKLACQARAGAATYLEPDRHSPPEEPPALFKPWEEGEQAPRIREFGEQSAFSTVSVHGTVSGRLSSSVPSRFMAHRLPRRVK